MAYEYRLTLDKKNYYAKTGRDRCHSQRCNLPLEAGDLVVRTFADQKKSVLWHKTCYYKTVVTSFAEAEHYQEDLFPENPALDRIGLMSHESF